MWSDSPLGLGMKNHITCVFELNLLPGKADSFGRLVAQAVEATSQEPGVLIYEYAISDDETKAYIVERYLPEALVPHVDSTFAPFAAPFLEHVTFAGLTVFGEVDADIRKRLDPFGATYIQTFAGFDRFSA